MKLGIDPNAIKGFLLKEEGESLYLAAKKYSKRGPCLEIGSYCGKSALYIGSAVKENNQLLYSIDHHKGSEEQQPGEEFFDPDLLDETGNSINSLPFFLDTISKAGLKDIVIPMVSTSVEVSKAWTKPLAMVFIDGGHSEKAANEDYDAWNPHIIPGGLLAIHDVFPNPEDGGRPPFNIYTKAKKSGLFKEVDMIGSLALLEKL
ncbi:MAG: class I SAM-dependent methyltransferase [SAR86 cluster bacterium]|jgi:predicted O-methyltransferase YrrM|nr:class I SAM-dependent methyltransferase [SAR86 cluster bacterium]